MAVQASVAGPGRTLGEAHVPERCVSRWHDLACHRPPERQSSAVGGNRPVIAAASGGDEEPRSGSGDRRPGVALDLVQRQVDSSPFLGRPTTPAGRRLPARVAQVGAYLVLGADSGRRRRLRGRGRRRDAWQVTVHRGTGRRRFGMTSARRAGEHSHRARGKADTITVTGISVPRSVRAGAGPRNRGVGRRPPGHTGGPPALCDGKIKIGGWIRFVFQCVVPPLAIVCDKTAGFHERPKVFTV